MAPKKSRVVSKKRQAKSHSKSSSSVGMTPLQKRTLLTLSLFVLMFYGLTHITVTSPILAQSSVLGDDDENREEKREEKREERREEIGDEKREEKREERREEKREEKREERREERMPEIRRIEDRKIPPKPADELENEIETEVEIHTRDGRKIKTKVEDDGSKKIEIEGRDFKLKYELHNGKFEARAEDENGESVDIPEDASDELEDSFEEELEEEGIEIDSSSDQPSIMKNGVRARSAFPLAINPVTRALIVTTPNGEKMVTVLPDEAMRRLKETGILDEIEAPKDGAASEETELVTHKNKMAYKIKGKKRHKMLGFIPFNTNVTTYVSAETGEPLEKEQSLVSSFVDSISF